MPFLGVKFSKFFLVADPSRGEAPPPCFFGLNEVYEQRNSIRRVQDLSQNAGNSQFGDLNFQKFVGEHASKPLVPSALIVIPPFESPGSAPGPARNFTCPAILQPWHLCRCWMHGSSYST